jgi:hypothetical protein
MPYEYSPGAWQRSRYTGLHRTTTIEWDLYCSESREREEGGRVKHFILAVLLNWVGLRRSILEESMSEYRMREQYRVTLSKWHTHTQSFRLVLWRGCCGDWVTYIHPPPGETLPNLDSLHCSRGCHGNCISIASQWKGVIGVHGNTGAVRQRY